MVKRANRKPTKSAAVTAHLSRAFPDVDIESLGSMVAQVLTNPEAPQWRTLAVAYGAPIHRNLKTAVCRRLSTKGR